MSIDEELDADGNPKNTVLTSDPAVLAYIEKFQRYGLDGINKPEERHPDYRFWDDQNIEMDMSRFKTCICCLKTYPSTPHFFHKDSKNKRIGLRPDCKVCNRANKSKRSFERRGRSREDKIARLENFNDCIPTTERTDITFESMTIAALEELGMDIEITQNNGE